MLAAFILFVTAIFLRVTVVRFAPEGSDEYGHLYYVKEVKAQSAGPFGYIVPKVVGARDFRQPFLWHWIMGMVPIQTLIEYKKWINPIADALFAVCVYGIGRNIGLDTRQSLWISAIYLCTPMWFSRLSIGPRIDSLTPRLASELVTNSFFMVTLLPLGLPLWLMLMGGGLLAAFVLLSSKFGLQALFFVVPLASLLTLNIIPLFAFLGGIFIAFSVTKGSLFETVKHQFIHLTWYFKKNRRGEMSVSKRNSMSKLLEGLNFKNDTKNAYLKVIKRLIGSNSYTAVLLKMPVLIAVFVLYIHGLVQGTYIPPGYITGPVMAAMLIFFLINIPLLLFLGEAERYLNHVAFFIVCAAVLFMINLNMYWILWALLSYGLVYWLFESFFLHRLMPDSESLKKDIDKDIITFLQSIKDPTVIISYPYNNAVGTWRAMLETKHRAAYPYMTTKKFLDFFEENYAADYPYFKLEKFEDMEVNLEINVLILEKSNLVSRGFANWEPAKVWKQIEVGDPVYKIYVKEPI